MIRRRRAKEDDYIGPLTGWPKFFHRLFLLVTFPLRKPLWTLLIALILFLTPTFMGVKPTEVHLWYWHHLKHSSTQVGTTVAKQAQKIAAELPAPAAPENIVAQTPAKVVELPAKKSRRTMFERANSAPVVVPEAVKAPATIAAEPAKTAKRLNIKYLDQPQNISGPAVVVSANELIVDGVEMFLFGIYANPTSENGQKAEAYLQEITVGQTVDCQINAYTFQAVATAICQVNGTNLNRELVKRGLSKNVALD